MNLLSLKLTFRRARINLQLLSAFCLVCLVTLLLTGCSETQQPSQTQQPLPSTQQAQTEIKPDAQREAKPDKSSSADCWRRIPGEMGNSDQFQSGWIQLTTMTNFKRGDQLRLSIGGSAHKIVVRLLPRGASPASPTGIIDTFTVPNSRVLVVTLDGDYDNIVQASVHGGANPWEMYPLGGGNGSAILLKLEVKCT